MALVNENRIIAKIMTDGDMRPVLDRGVTAEWFVNRKHRDAFEFVLKHFEKYGAVPNRATFVSHMGTGYKILSISESLDYLLDTQADALRWQTARTMLPVVQDALKDNDTAGAVKSIEEHLARIHRFQPTPSRIVDSMDTDRAVERWHEYEERAKKRGLLGYSTGFPTIDSTTLGLQPGHLVTVVANAKVGKTTLCLCMANHVYKTYSAPVLFVSFEMGIREMEMRQEALMAKVNFRDLQAAELGPADMGRYKAHLSAVKDEYHWPFHFMDASSGSTVGAVRAQIERFDPAVVFVDGIYMLTDEVTGEQNTAQALTNITRSLKRLATQTGRPIVINTQALGWKMRGSKLSLNSIGYASSFAQDSDVVLGIERTEDDGSAADNSRVLKVLASRNSGLTQVELSFDYASGNVAEFSDEEE